MSSLTVTQRKKKKKKKPQQARYGGRHFISPSMCYEKTGREAGGDFDPGIARISSDLCCVHFRRRGGYYVLLSCFA